MKSQRDTFWEEVYNLMLKDEDIVIVIADMGAPFLDNIRRDFPKRVVDVGIAEQNAILISSGLALEGKKVFVYAIAPFITLRCLEQIRVQNSIMKIPITIVGVGAGFGYPDSGPTHFQLEDIAIMRALPGIIINSISDNFMAKRVVQFSYECEQTNYIRLDRELSDVDLTRSKNSFNWGYYFTNYKQLPSKDCVITTGNMTQYTSLFLDEDIIDIHTIPIIEEYFILSIGNYRSLITIEEHFLSGGLGSYILEILNKYNINIPIKRIGLDPDKGYCYRYGGREDLRNYYNIDKEGIMKQINEFKNGL